MRQIDIEVSDIETITVEPQTKEYVEIAPQPIEVNQNVMARKETSQVTTKTAPTAEQLKTQIEELQRQLQNIEKGDGISTESIEHSLTSEELEKNCKINIHTIQAELSKIKGYIEKKIAQKIILVNKEKRRKKIIAELYKMFDQILSKSYNFLREIFAGGRLSSKIISELSVELANNTSTSKYSPEMIRLYKWTLAVNMLINEVRISLMSKHSNISLEEALQKTNDCLKKIDGFEYKEPPDLNYLTGDLGGTWY